LTDDEMTGWAGLAAILETTNRVARRDGLWFAVEQAQPTLTEMVRGRLEIGGPMTEQQLAALTRATLADVEVSALELESQGSILRGTFTPRLVGAAPVAAREWCDRRL